MAADACSNATTVRVKSEDIKISERTSNVSNIRFGIDAEIDTALSHYCKDELRLSKVYWPKAFRSLVANILSTLLNKPDAWSSFCTAEFMVSEEQIKQLLEELQKSTSTYIKVKQRRWIIHLLREMSLFRKKFEFSVRLSRCYSSEEKWPDDIEDRDDLLDSLTDMSLRDDVKKFIWKIINEAVPSNKYCNLHFYGAFQSLKKSFPIVIETVEDSAVTLNDRIATVSDLLRMSGCENLLPIDIIEVKPVADREVVFSNEELN